jgi:O-antigen/teichoic acid export membrane protein
MTHLTITLLYYMGKFIHFCKRSVLAGTLTLFDRGIYYGIHHSSILFASLDLSPGIMRHLVGFAGDRQKKAAFFSWIMLATTLCYMSIGLLFYLFRHQLQAFFFPKATHFVTFLPYAFITGYLLVINITLKAWCRALGHLVAPNFFQNVCMRLLMVGNIYLFARWHHTLVGLLQGGVACYVFVITCYAGYLSYHGELAWSWIGRYFDMAFVRSFLNYSLFTLLGHGVMVIMPRLDVVMVLGRCGEEAAAVYDAVVCVVLLLEIPSKVSKQVSEVKMATSLAQGDHRTLALHLQRTVCHLLLVWLFVFLLIHTNLDMFFNYMLGSHPNVCQLLLHQLFYLLSFAELVGGVFYISYTLLLLSDYYRLSLCTILLLALGGASNIACIRCWGVQGAAIATVGTMLFGMSMLCMVLWRYLHVQPFSRAFFSLLLLGALMGILTSCLPFSPLVRTFILVPLYLNITYMEGFWHLPKRT